MIGTSNQAAPPGFRHAATAVLFGIIGVALITLAGARLNVTMFPSPGVGLGTISLVYLIVVVFVSLRADLVYSVAVSLVAAFCLTYSGCSPRFLRSWTDMPLRRVST